MLFLTLGSTAYAGVDRKVEAKFITNGAATMTVPTTTGTVLSDNNSISVTGKTMSGATNTFSAIPAATALSGAVPVANGGTGATSASDGLNALLPSQTSNGGKFLKTDGSAASWDNPGATPVLTSSFASPSILPRLITGGGILTLTAPGYSNFIWAKSSSGLIDVTATPSITIGTAVGQQLHVIGTSDTDAFTLQDQAALPSSQLQLNGNWVSSAFGVLNLMWDGLLWVETSRSQ